MWEGLYAPTDQMWADTEGQIPKNFGEEVLTLEIEIGTLVFGLSLRRLARGGATFPPT